MSSSQAHGPSGLKSSLFMILTHNQSWISHGHHLLPTSCAKDRKKHPHTTIPAGFIILLPNMLHTCPYHISVTRESLHPKDGDVGVFPHAAVAIGVVHDTVV